MTLKLLHYGLQRSGTNYIDTIFRKRYRIKWLNSNQDTKSPIQKHVRLYEDKSLVGDPNYANDLHVPDFDTFESLVGKPIDYYLVISKDPYSWLLSYQKWADKCGWTPPAHHYVEEYNAFYGIFLKLAAESDKIVFIRYNDLLQDLTAELDRLEKRMGLQYRMFASRKSEGPKKVGHSGDFDNDRLNYYLRHDYLKKYTPDRLDAVNEKLDPAVMEGLGYEFQRAVPAEASA